MRGEHLLVGTIPTAETGSSPHARGARGRHLQHSSQLGIIPACAGSTGTDRN